MNIDRSMIYKLKGNEIIVDFRVACRKLRVKDLFDVPSS